ncbi:MAG: hypothetical protein KJ592_04945 [Nanoarchaeota archaeon]|nr:hypothetical protein [Nanoarchaeota archaeon]
MKDVWVISLGGSRIVPDSVDDKFLLRFKKMIESHPSVKFVVVCGGGSTARRYILALRKLGKGAREQSEAGIGVTRFHSNFMMRFFGTRANEELPLTKRKVRNLLRGNQVVFCGALRWGKGTTSDGTAAGLAGYLKCPFINLTNVKGLYDKEPSLKGAKFIPEISWEEFDMVASKVKFKAGQHFVLDQAASKKIRKGKIVTYIVGSVTDIDKILKGKRFVGTRIFG